LPQNTAQETQDTDWFHQQWSASAPLVSWQGAVVLLESQLSVLLQNVPNPGSA
jgi:hypothetical protein